MNNGRMHRGPASGSLHVHVSTNSRIPVPLPRIAVLGTGKMGSAIAGRLARAGYDLTVWNRTRSRADALGLGLVADSPAAATRDAEVIISSLTGPDAVRAAYLGPNGALASASGQLFIDMSTAGADIVVELASAIGPTGARLVDAPILGAPSVVRDGQASILIGGETADAERATEILRAVGQTRHVGPLGSGARLKLVANGMLADVVLAAAELQVAGEDAGLDAADVFWVLQRLVPSLGMRQAGYLENRHAPPLFALRDLAKDLDLGLVLFGRASTTVPVTRLVRSLVIDAARRTAGLDITSVILAYRSDPSTAAVEVARRESNESRQEVLAHG